MKNEKKFTFLSFYSYILIVFSNNCIIYWFLKRNIYLDLHEINTWNVYNCESSAFEIYLRMNNNLI